MSEFYGTSSKQKLGVIADDLTGATDIAVGLVGAGYLVTVVTERFPDKLSDCDAIVVALKTRSADPPQAVARTKEGLDYLVEHGVSRFYSKYASTFDSTERGNIGPILAAAIEFLGVPGVILVPSFPAAARTVYKGHLFAGDQLVSESPMKDHPLNPMTESYLPKWLQQQTTMGVGLVCWQTVRRGASAVQLEINAAFGRGERLVVVDALDDSDLRTIAAASADMKLISGGSGLAGALQGPGGSPDSSWQVPSGPRIILSGSASVATCGQVAHVLRAGSGVHLSAVDLKSDFEGTIGRTVECALYAGEKPFVVYATEDPLDVNPAFSQLFEQAFAALAQRLVERGVEALVVAGGETSGAVCESLGVQSMEMRSVLAPGVAWADALLADGRTIALVLKSGNFGGQDLLIRCWENDT